MFTGIIEEMGTVREVRSEGGNKTFWIESPLSSTLKIDQSVSHDGICLTVEEVRESAHRVTAIAETLAITNSGDWQPGTRVNLELCMRINSRLDGHIVQGHVDGTAECTRIEDKSGSWELRFAFNPADAALVIEKGSVCLNGISLTAFSVSDHEFTVAIIPYTWSHTNISDLHIGRRVNLEFDLVGKYILRAASLQDRRKK